jgi:hypothetical protein
MANGNWQMAKVEIPPRPAQRVRDPLIIRWPDFFIPGAPPAPFDEDVIERSSVAIQADPNPAGEQPTEPNNFYKGSFLRGGSFRSPA